MAEELISSYIDQAAIKSQTDFLVQQLERAKTQYKSLSEAIKNIQKSTTFTDTAKITAAAEKEQQALLKTQQQIIKAKQEQVKLENQLLQQQILQEKQAQANLKTTQAQSKVKTQVVTESITKPGFADDVTKAGTVVSEFDKAQAEAAISATEFGNSLNKNAKIIKDEVTPAVKATTLTEKQLALAKEEGLLLAQKERAALKNQVREELAVKGSLEQRRAALIRLNAVYDNQSPSERASAAGQRLQKIIGGLDTQVKTLEANTGRSQRNVGNYASALDKVKEGAQRAWTGIRTLANIIPGLGLSGVFLLGYEAILQTIQALGLFKDKVFDTARQQKTLVEISEKATASFADEGVKLRLLSAEYQNANTSSSRRKDIQKELNALAPAYFSNLQSEAEFMKGITENTRKASEALLIKAKIEAASGVLTAKYKELLDKLFDPSKALSFNDKLKSATRDIGTTLRNIATPGIIKEGDLLDLAGRAEKGVNKAKIEYDRFEDFIKQFIFGANIELEKLGGDPGKESSIVKPVKKAQEKLSDLLDETFERYKLKQQRLLDTLNEGANDESAVYETRIGFLEEFNRQQKNLIDEQEAFELQKNENKKLAAIKAAKGNSKEIAIVTANAEEAAKTISLRAQLDILKADEDYYKRKLKLREDYDKVQQDFADQEYEYERQLQEKLEQLRQARLKDAKRFDDEDEKRLEEKKKQAQTFLETLQGYFNQVSSIISGAFNISTTKRKNEAQAAIEAIEAQRDAELRANDARVQSEQDKAANISIINSRAEQQKKAQEQRQRQANIRQAQAEKALSIFQITLATALNVAKAKTIPEKIIQAVLGAAQLAIAVATPIPKFKHGKRRGQAYEGPGIVNDGPNMEVIERADGSIEMPQGRNVLTHVGANDIIHPDRERWVNSVLNAAMRDGNIKQRHFAKGDNQLAAAMIQQTKLLKQIADKPVAKTYASDRGLAQVITWGVNQVKYIEQQTNWK